MNNRARQQYPERLYFLGALVLIVAIYLPALMGRFVWDDVLLIVHNSRIKSWQGIIDAFRLDFFYGITEIPRITYYRPLITILNVITYQLFGLKPFFFHLENLLLHIANVGLVYFLLRLAFRASPMASFFASLIFAVHPVNTEAVAFISGRTDLLATFCFLLALVTINLRHYHQLTSTKLFVFLTFVFYVAGLLAKEHVVVLGPVILLIDYFQSKAQTPQSYLRQSRSFILSITALWLSITFVYFFVRFFLIKGIGAGAYPGGTFLLTMLTMAKVFWHYIYLLILPLSQLASYQNFFMVVGMPGTFSTLHIIRLVLAIIGVLIFIGLSIILFLTKNCYALPLWWFILTLAPVLNIVPFGIWLAERFLYLPSVALAIICAFVLEYLWQKTRAQNQYLVSGLAILLILFYSVLAFQRSLVWRTNDSLWRDILSKNPHNDVALGNLAELMLAKHKYKDALSYVENALLYQNTVLRPLLLRIKTQVLINLKQLDEAEQTLAQLEQTHYNPARVVYFKGQLALQCGNTKQALQYFQQSSQLAPDLIAPRVALIKYYLKQNYNFEQVRRLALEILRINPDYAYGYLYLGIAEQHTGNPLKAIKYFQQAIHREPKNPEHYFFLANLYDELGNKDKKYLHLALRTYGKVLFLDPDHLDAMLNMGLTYVKIGKLLEAKELWQRILQHDPDNYEARANLARLAKDLLRSH